MNLVYIGFLFSLILIACNQTPNSKLGKKYVPRKEVDSIFNELSKALKNPPAVAYLDIYDTDSGQIQDFEKSLLNFSNLHEIIFKGSDQGIINILVESIGKLNLETLTINSDSRVIQFKSIPPSNLKELSATSKNAIIFDSSINQLKNLNVLSLTSKKVVLPTNINQLSKLRIVALNKLQEIQLPSGFYDLSLNRLDLEDSKINYLDPRFCNFKELKLLLLGGTPLGEKEFLYRRKTRHKKYTVSISNCLPNCQIYVGYFVGFK